MLAVVSALLGYLDPGRVTFSGIAPTVRGRGSGMSELPQVHV